MKLASSLSTLALLAVLATGCLQNNDYEPAMTETSKSLTISATVKSNGTKAETSAIKNDWNTNESIEVISTTTGAEARFLSVNSGNTVEFAATASFEATSVAAVYPYMKNVANGTSFSFNGQKGTLESAQNFSLMTATGSVNNGMARLSFEHKTSVLCLSNIVLNGIDSNAKVAKVVLEGVAVSANVAFQNNTINVSEAETGSITVSTDLSEDAYISFLASNASSIQVTVYDNLGGEFSYTLDNGSNFAAGQCYTISGVSFEGGYPISFNPSTEGWND